MDSSTVTLTKLQQIYKAKGYPIFNDPFDLNLFGIRAANPVVNAYCDLLGIMYWDDQIQPHVFIGVGTTEIGLLFLGQNEKVQGTFIMKEGFYYNLFVKENNYLIQSNNVSGYQNVSRNSKLELIPGPDITGNFNISWRHSFVDLLKGLHNSGDQVWRDIQNFNVAMSLVDSQIKYGHGDKFSYTLLNEGDL